MTKAEKRARLAKINEILADMYPDVECALKYDGDPWKLLVMGRLSAQCTDARVNEVAVELFSVFPTARDMANGDLAVIEEIVKPCGLYRMKAANIKDASRILIEEYNGILPDEIEELVKLPGVGRKIANMLVGDIYGKSAVVCDTHMMRIMGRIGFYDEGLRDAVKVEKILRALINDADGSDLCHRAVILGREICDARSPRCSECPLSDICRYNLGGKSRG